MKPEHILAALTVVIVVLLVFTFAKLNGNAESCATKLHDLPGKTGLTAAEICATMGGTWDIAKSTCAPNPMFAACDNVTGMLRDVCAIQGGKYYPGCEICSGPNVRREIALEEALPVFAEHCPKLLA
jgi:hypothetical protein